MARLYRLYIDESGDHTFGDVEDAGKRYLGLTGCIIEGEEYRNHFQPELENLKRRHFDYDLDEPPILHRKDIINCSGCFWPLRDEAKCRAFNEELLVYFRDMQYRLITVVIDKKAHTERYGEAAFHPYHYCMAAMLERYAGFLNFYNAHGDVMAESRGGKEDRLLREAYRQVYQSGTQWRGSQFFNDVLTSRKLKIKLKILNIAGLQVADLLAYPIKQEILIEYGRIDDPGEIFSKEICNIVRGKHNRQVYQNRVTGYGKVFLE
jgi:hypothetical protein